MIYIPIMVVIFLSDMNVLHITSTANAIVKDTCMLKQKKTRDERGVFITEGMKMLGEAIKSGVNIKSVFVTEDVFQKNEEYITNIKPDSIYVTSDAVMAKLSEWKTPQGILSVNEKKQLSIDNCLKNDNAFVIILDGVSDPGNIGTIIRTSEAAGVSAIFTTPGTADCYQSKALRASMGSIFRISVFENIEKCDIIYKMNQFGIPIVATSLSGKDIFEFNIDNRAALVFGNEGSGISMDFVNNADMLVRLPMEGDVESLNVAVSAGIIMYLIHNSKMKNNI